MQRTLSIAFVVAAMLIGATPWSAAQAMPLAAPTAIGAPQEVAPITRVANICGLSGCAPVQTKRVHKPPPNFVKMAVPMTVAPPPQNAAPIK
jgi:hypothetical protein